MRTLTSAAPEACCGLHYTFPVLSVEGDPPKAIMATSAYVKRGWSRKYLIMSWQVLRPLGWLRFYPAAKGEGVPLALGVQKIRKDDRRLSKG